ncbi:MAG: MoaD/ThiS family protein [Firmicutes bacterium]|nr:MoaD/ThiS family protein [Bacillota bacterium]
MVTVKFFNLIRSNHNVAQVEVNPGTIEQIIDEIRQTHPQITTKEFKDAVLFINRKKVMHLSRFSEEIDDGDEIVFTNFVGGG